ncbi:uncharacterized protein LOC134490014 [Candoia aspera]|uniref:uncharacterized protein LOC134490014 n=1 Tax=Candoia aspera TaxID=51853 RepID=UPI002FD83155
MKPSSGPRFGRQHFPVVYVTRFGKHCCGTKIHSGGKSPPKKVALAEPHSRLTSKASSVTLDKRGSGGVAPWGQRRRHGFAAGAALTMQVQGSRTSRRQPPSEGQSISVAKPPSQEASELPPSRKKGWGSKRGAAHSTISGTQKCLGISTTQNLSDIAHFPKLLLSRCSQEENRGDEFEFSASKENVNQMTREQKKKSAVWSEVSEVISKMVEENGYFRNRLMSYCHFSSEGREINQNLQSEISCIETDEAIFGWV